MSLRKVLGAIRQADQDFGLIENQDKIAVGISGGKDSIVLLYALSLYQKFCPHPFQIVGIHIQLGFPDMDFSTTRDFCNKHQIEFVEYPSDVYEILKLNLRKNGMLECSICSRMKKALVIKAAKEHHCNKVAFAHHVDDAIETLFLNMIYGGRIATFDPMMQLTKSDITFIRPFIYAREKDILRAQKKENLPVVVSTCPNDKHTQREDIKQLLNTIYKTYPSAYDNFKLMLSNTKKMKIFHKNPQFNHALIAYYKAFDEPFPIYLFSMTEEEMLPIIQDCLSKQKPYHCIKE